MKDKSLEKLKAEWEEVGADSDYRLFIKGDMTISWNNEYTFKGSGLADTKYICEYLKNNGFKLKQYDFLEIGCGVGRMAEFLSEHVHKYIGIDISSTMVKRAQERCPGLKFLTAHSLKEVEPNSIDMVFSYGVFQHIPKTLARKYFKEAKKILKQNGYIVFQLPIASDNNIDINRTRPHYLSEKLNLRDAVSFRYWSKDEFAELINGYKYIGEFNMTEGSTFYIIQK